MGITLLLQTPPTTCRLRDQRHVKPCAIVKM